MVVVMIHLRIIAIILSIVVCRLASGQYLKSDAPQIINNSNYSARVESSNYFLDNDTIWSKFYTLKNTSNDTLWIMFDHKSHNSDYEFIKNLFFSRSYDGTRLFNALLDGNVYWTIGVFSGFFKLLPPKKSFNILIEGDSIPDIDLLINKARIIPQSFIFDNFRLIKHHYKNFDNQIFYYDKDYLLINRNMLKYALQK